MFDIVEPMLSLPTLGYAYVTRPLEYYNADDDSNPGIRVRLMTMEGWESKWYDIDDWARVVSTQKYKGEKLKIGDYLIGNQDNDYVGEIVGIHYRKKKVWEYRLRTVPEKNWTEDMCSGYLYPDQIARFHKTIHKFEF